MKDTREIVLKIMTQEQETRDNDNLLIARFLKKRYGTADMEKIAEITNKSVTESITRARRKIQESNPLMYSSYKTSQGRKRKEAQVKEWARGL